MPPRLMHHARARRRLLAAIVLVACIITPVFNVLTVPVSLRAAIQGLVDAVLISVPVGIYLIYVRDGVLRARFRRLRFLSDFGLSSAIVLTMFLVGRAAGQVITTLEPRRFLTSFTERHLLYALPFFVVAVVTIQFVVQMNRLIGANVLATSRPASTTDRRPRSASSCSSTSRAPPSSPSGWAARATSSCCAASWTT